MNCLLLLLFLATQTVTSAKSTISSDLRKRFPLSATSTRGLGKSTLLQTIQQQSDSSVRTDNSRKNDDYATQQAATSCRSGTQAFKAGHYSTGASAALQGLKWLTGNRSSADTLHFQLLSLAAACYGRVPLADSATYWYTRTNDYLTAHPVLRQFIPSDVCGYYLNHANFLNRTGDSGRALVYLEIAAQLAQAVHNQRLLAIIENYKGNYFFQRKQFDQSGAHYRLALRYYRPNSVDQCWGYIILGNNDRMAGHPAQGLRELQKGQQLYEQHIVHHREEQDVDFSIQSAYYTAECWRAMHQWQKATTAYQACQTLHQRQYGSKGEFIAFSWLGLSYIAQHQGKRRQALTLAHRGTLASCYRLNTQSSPNDYVGTVVNEKTLYQCLRQEADIWRDEWLVQRTSLALTKAVDHYDRALGIAARLRRNLLPVESKFFFNAQVAPLVERAIAGSFALYNQTRQDRYKHQLFDLIERHRAMVSADLLHEKYRLSQTIPPSLAQREQHLRQQKIDIEKGFGSSTISRPDSLRRQLSTIQVRSYQFLDSLEAAHPRYYALKYETRALTVQDVQQQLPNQTGYLTYYVSQGYLIGFLIQKTSSHAFKMTLPSHFTTTIDQLWAAIHQAPGMFTYTGRSAATTLYNWLIRPVAQDIRSTRRLVIARDGPLHYIPFDLLQSAGTADETYLGDQVAISYGYSANLTFTPAPHLANHPPRIIGFAPYQPAVGSTAEAGVASLRASQAEVEAWTKPSLIHQSATKASFLKLAPLSHVIVLATHALADEQQPEQSYVAFSPVQTDYRLRSIEIANLALDSVKLVILSACEGNAGPVRQGEGLLSLARAFRLAGCPAVLTTAWKASDESTAAFNSLFRQYVAEGLPTDLALQRTRSDFRTDKRFSQWKHPFYWANFSLIGTPAPIYPEPWQPQQVLWLLAFSGLVLGGWLVGKRLSHTKPGQPA